MKQDRTRADLFWSWWQAMDGGANISNKSLSEMYSDQEHLSYLS